MTLRGHCRTFFKELPSTLKPDVPLKYCPYNAVDFLKVLKIVTIISAETTAVKRYPILHAFALCEDIYVKPDFVGNFLSLADGSRHRIVWL